MAVNKMNMVLPHYVLTDIEGTTTSIDFVHKILFPYAHERLQSFIVENDTDEYIRHCLNEVGDTIRDEEKYEPQEQQIIDTLLRYSKEDRKHPALKKIQGRIWKIGYETGVFKSHIYPDVIPAFEEWAKLFIKPAVFSSGSIEAQDVLFQNTTFGDIRKYFANFFDTTTGGKRDAHTYRKIARLLKTDTHLIIFLSDVVEELDAAKEAGMRPIQIVRENTKPTDKHPTATEFSQVLSIPH